MEYPQNLTVSERRWFDLIRQCRTSGKSDAQWMQEHDIKSPTFYYHVKQLRKKACDIPENSFSRQRNDVQEVVPLFMDETPSVVCQTAHCGRCEQHFIVGAFTSPTVRFGR